MSVTLILGAIRSFFTLRNENTFIVFFFTSRLAHAPPPISFLEIPLFAVEYVLLRVEVQAFFVIYKLK